MDAPRRHLFMVVHAYYPLAEPRVEREAKAARDAGIGVEVVCLRAPGEWRRETAVRGPDRRELVRDRVPEEKVDVVMNSAGERLIERVADDVRGRHGDDKPFTLAYHGTITEWYGVDLVIEALARLSSDLPDA